MTPWSLAKNHKETALVLYSELPSAMATTPVGNKFINSIEPPRARSGDSYITSQDYYQPNGAVLDEKIQLNVTKDDIEDEFFRKLKLHEDQAEERRLRKFAKNAE
jgi:hypothetical protein